MEQIESKKSAAKKDIDFHDALSVITDAIASHAERISKISKSTEDLDPVTLEGKTTKGDFVHILVDPKIVAKVLYEYDYSVYAVLELDAPQGMWDELAEIFGLERVFRVDL